MNRLLLSSLNAAKQINARNAKLASANEARKVTPRASSVPHSPRMPASASVILNESKPSPLTSSNTSSIQQISSVANTPTPKGENPGFFSSLISNRMSRASSVSDNQNQPVRAQRSQTMSVPAEHVSPKVQDLSTALQAEKLVEEPIEESKSDNLAHQSEETDLSNAEPPKTFNTTE